MLKRFWLLLAVPLFFVGNALADVTVRGTIRYYDPEKNAYVPLKKAMVEVEFDCWDACDKKVHTDYNGFYQTTQRNPNWPYSSWEVNLDVHAEYTDRFQVYDSWWSLWPYYVISRTIDCNENSTCTLDLWIGGPSSTVNSYEYGNAANNQAAFFTHQEMLGHYDWMVNHAASTSDFEEKEVFYPDTSSQYMAVIDYIYLKPITDRGPTRFSYVVRHEYSHSMQADVYWMMPLGWESIEYWISGDPHNPTVQTGAEYAFIEGWAEFLPTVTNPRSSGPLAGVYQSSRDYNFEDSRTDWRASLPASIVNWKCEGDVAGVLWDIYDPKGKEKTLLQYPDIPGDETWDDQISDPNLTKIWTILKEDEPDAILDDGDLWLDSFWYYWNRRYGNAHEMKAIYFNRGIHLETYPQHPPTVSIHKVTQQQTSAGWQVTLDLEVAEQDAEDRPHLELQVWSTKPRQLPVLELTRQVTGTWSGASKLVTLQITKPAAFSALTQILVSVNDDMEYSKATWTIPLVLPPVVIVNPLGAALKAVQVAKSAIPMRSVKRPVAAPVARAARPAASAANRPRSQWRSAPITAAVKGYRNAYKGYGRALELACRQQAKLAYDLGRRLGLAERGSLQHIHRLCRPLPAPRPSTPEPPALGKLRSLVESLAAGTLTKRLSLPAAEKTALLGRLQAVEKHQQELASYVETAHRYLVTRGKEVEDLRRGPAVQGLGQGMRRSIEAMLGSVVSGHARMPGDLARARQAVQGLGSTVRAVRAGVQ
jgi:hypothetical protein